MAEKMQKILRKKIKKKEKLKKKKLLKDKKN